MRERRQVVCLAGGKRIDVFPAILGFTHNAEKAFVLEVGGEDDSELPPGGAWRCLTLAGVRVLELREGPWPAPVRPGDAQTCVEVVEYDADPDTRYGPRFRL